MIKLLLSSLKQTFRDKGAVFWSFVFPAIFIIIFSFFNFEGSVSAHIIVIDQANTEISNKIIKALLDFDGVGINKDFSDIDEAKIKLEKSEKIEFTFKNDERQEYKEIATVNVILLFPKGYGDMTSLLSTTDEPPFKVQLFYNQANDSLASPSKIVASILDHITNEINLQIVHGKNLFSTNRDGISVNEIRYYDILVPGIIGMGIMQAGIIGMASTIASYKEKRVLKRLSATPLPIWKFILSEVITHLVLSTLQVTLMLVLAKYVLNANIYGSIPLIYLLCFFGNFVFLAIGFIAAALSKTARAAENLSQVFSMPMMFLSGVFFERDSLPEVVKFIANLLPLSPLLDALRAVSLREATLYEVRDELLIVLIWTLVSFIIAVKVFKFREE